MPPETGGFYWRNGAFFASLGRGVKLLTKWRIAPTPIRAGTSSSLPPHLSRLAARLSASLKWWALGKCIFVNHAGDLSENIQHAVPCCVEVIEASKERTGDMHVLFFVQVTLGTVFFNILGSAVLFVLGLYCYSGVSTWWKPRILIRSHSIIIGSSRIGSCIG